MPSDGASRRPGFLTPHVTEFFRDRAQFAALGPLLLSTPPPPDRSLEMWSAGCSNGAEPYSLAILLMEQAPNVPYRVLATDVDAQLLALAAAGGPYLPADLRHVSPPLVRKYFSSTNSGFYVKPAVRRHVEFRQHDLLKEAYPSGFDLVVCRNVVLYFVGEARAKVYAGFADALKLGGLLFIGLRERAPHAEAIGLKRLSTCFYQRVASA